MIAAPTMPLTELYEADETAWLDAMAGLAAEGRSSEFNLPNLQEFLESMAIRDRRETINRLIVLLMHILKWEYQPDGMSGLWRSTIREQRRQLRAICERGVLRNHADDNLAEAYDYAKLNASDETGLDLSNFPKECPWTLDQILADDDT